jgi:PleD family two-component response regulator
MQKKFQRHHRKNRGARRPQGGTGSGNGNQNGNQQGQHAGIYRNPMGQPRHFIAGLPEDIEPIQAPEMNADGTAGAALPTILAAIDDLFFSVKITETARKVGATVRFVKTDKELLAAADEDGEKPSLIIVDLNSAAMKPISTIVKLKADKDLKKTSVIGYLSHVQGELKQKAHEAGCDMVLARSAFSQNLPNLLRRHGSSRG